MFQRCSPKGRRYCLMLAFLSCSTADQQARSGLGFHFLSPTSACDYAGSSEVPQSQLQDNKLLAQCLCSTPRNQAVPRELALHCMACCFKSVRQGVPPQVPQDGRWSEEWSCDVSRRCQVNHCHHVIMPAKP